MASPVWNSSFFVVVVVFSLLSLSIAPISATSEDQVHTKVHVVTLDHSNFSDFVTKHEFTVVEFYAPWCGHCQSLAPEYEKAASILSSHEPQVVLAKVDASEPENKDLASKYEVQGFPTLKIVRKGGTTVQDYNGPRDADGIVTYLKKQAGPASSEINSAEEASTLIDAKKIFIVGVFPKFSGAEFESFIAVAEKLRADYDFGHTLDAKVIPQGDSSVIGPTVRLLKPFDELVVDFQDFEVDTLEKLILESSLPTVTLFDTGKDNHPFLVKFFSSSNAKAMLFLNFTTAPLDSFKSKYHDVALLYKGKGISFLLGDLEASKSAFQYFGLKEDQVPLIIIQTSDGKKFLKVNLEPDQIAPWLKEYQDGSIKPFIRSAPIPEVNNEPVKVVVADNLQEMVLNSGKNVLLEFYAPWCGHCKKLAPILDEIAISFENDPDVIIAKMDATENDIVDERFDVKGYPTLYFRSGSGNISQYQGGRTKEDIIDFINTNKAVQSDSKKDEL